MNEDVRAAARRFPGQQDAIEALAVVNEEFRSLCVDLSDAEAGLRLWETSDAPNRERLRAEYRALIDDLAEEIRALLKGESNR